MQRVFAAEVHELVSAIIALREERRAQAREARRAGARPRSASRVTQLGLIAAYEHLHPEDTIFSLLGLPTGVVSS